MIDTDRLLDTDPELHWRLFSDERLEAEIEGATKCGPSVWLKILVEEAERRGW